VPEILAVSKQRVVVSGKERQESCLLDRRAAERKAAACRAGALPRLAPPPRVYIVIVFRKRKAVLPPCKHTLETNVAQLALLGVRSNSRLDY
jgi:hypothetical protein